MDENNDVLNKDRFFDELFEESDVVDINPNDGSQCLSVAPPANTTNNVCFNNDWGTWLQNSDEANTYRDDQQEQGTNSGENQQPEPSGCTLVETQNQGAPSKGYQAAAAIETTSAQSTTGEQLFWDPSDPTNKLLNELLRRMMANGTQEVPADGTATGNGPYSQFPADVSPANGGSDPLSVNPAMISNVDATGRPLVNFNDTAIMPGPTANLGIESLTSGYPNDAPNLATEQPAPDHVSPAPARNQAAQDIQIRRKKPSRSQQKAHFEKMGVKVGYEFKRDGEVCWTDGQLFWLDPRDTWKPAVYHVDLRAKFLQVTDAQGVYTHPPAMGQAALDRTSFFAPHRDWGFEARAYRPDILFRWEEVEVPEVPHPGFMVDQGRIVLDSHNHPVINWDMPLTISTEVEGGRLEAMHRLNPKINKDDFCARMPNERMDLTGKVQNRQIPNAFGQRMLRFRMKAALPTWNTKTGSEEVRARTVECIPRETMEEILRTNSTRCTRDLCEQEVRYVEQGNAGKAVTRAGNNRLPKAERAKRYKKKFDPLKDFDPPNKRPWPEDFAAAISGTRKRKRSESGFPRPQGADSELSGFQSVSPNEWQGSDFSRDTGYGQGPPQATEEKENIPPARRGEPRPYHDAKGMPKDQLRPNDQPTPHSQAQQALNDHLPVQGSDFWQQSGIDRKQRKHLHSTTEGHHYARNFSTDSNSETPIISSNTPSQRLDYEASPYNPRQDFKIYVAPESQATYKDTETSETSYGQSRVAAPPSGSTRKRRVDEAFSQDEMPLPPSKSTKKRNMNQAFSQDETALPPSESNRKRKVDAAFAQNDVTLPPNKQSRKRKANTAFAEDESALPPNEHEASLSGGDGRYDDPESFDEVRAIASAVARTLDEVAQRVGYKPEIPICENHSYIRQFSQIENWFVANWKGTKRAPKLETLEGPWIGGIPAAEELFPGF